MGGAQRPLPTHLTGKVACPTPNPGPTKGSKPRPKPKPKAPRPLMGLVAPPISVTMGEIAAPAPKPPKP